MRRGSRLPQWVKGATTAFLCGALLLGAVARSQQISDDPLALARRAVLVGNEAYVALPPVLVSGTGIKRGVLASPDGNFLLVTETILPAVRDVDFTTTTSKLPESQRAKINVLLWNVRAQQGTVVWRGAVTDTQLSVPVYMDWLPGTQTAILRIMSVQVDENKQAVPGTTQNRLVFVNAMQGTTRTVATIAPMTVDDTGDYTVTCLMPPKLAIISSKSDNVRILRADGTTGRTFTVNVPGVDKFSFQGWRDDGNTLYGYSVTAVPGTDKDGKPQTRRDYKTVLLDTETGAITTQDGRPDPKWRRNPEALRFTPPPVAATLGDGKVATGQTVQSVKPLWLSGIGKDAEGHAFLAADAEEPLVLPGAVVYQSQGALFAAPLVKMDRAAFIGKRREAQKTATVIQAKQIALGLMMYAQDYDERFPTSGDAAEVVQPYIKNSDIFNNPETGKPGLQLVYKQTGLADYKTPSTDVLGYLSGPGGRAVIYVDGHIKWEDDPAKP